MSPRTLLASAGLLVLLLAASACGSSETAIEVAGSSVQRSDFVDQVESWAVVSQQGSVTAGDSDTAIGVDPGVTASWATLWTNFSALRSWAEQRGIQITDEHRAQAEQLVLSQFQGSLDPDDVAVREVIGWQTTLNAILDDEDLMAEAREQYPQIAEQAEIPLLCSRHVLLEDEAAARAVLDRLEQGENFNQVAIEESVDPSVQQNGGELGCLPRGSLVPEFEDPAWEASAGDLVGPVESDFGFHVIEVLRLGPPDEAEVAQRYSEAIQGDLVRGTSFLYDQVYEDVDVHVDPRFGTWDAERRQVLPPAGSTARPADGSLPAGAG